MPRRNHSWASGWESIEHLGPITRWVADAALMLSVIAGPDPRDRHSIPCCDVDWCRSSDDVPLGLRIANCPDWVGRPLDPEVRTICDAAAERFECDLGCNVELTNPMGGWEIDAFRSIVAMDTDIDGIRRLIAESEKPVATSLKNLLKR